MPSRRTERVAEAIREVIASAILFEVSDPRVKGVTVIQADVSGDLRNATVHVSLMGTETEQEQALRGLQSARGFLQSRMAARLQTRSTPILSFKVDEGVKKSIAMSRLIDEAIASDRRPEAHDTVDNPGDQDQESTGGASDGQDDDSVPLS